MLIGFTHKTSKILPRILCRRFRHCAVVINKKRKMKNEKCFVMYQVGKGSIKQIPLSARDLKILEQHGWVFIDYTTLSPYCLGPALSRHYTCVGFAKHILEIRDPFIITPDQLYKKLAHGAQRLEY